MVQIIKQLRKVAPQAKLLVITPPVVDDTRRMDPLDRTNAQVGTYAAACADASRAEDGVELLDLYSYLMATFPNATARAELLSDGLHLSDKGNRVVFEQIHQQIKTMRLSP